MSVFFNLGNAVQEELKTNGIIEVLVSGNQTIWVDPNRSDTYTATGSFTNPYTTLAAAVAALTVLRPNILLMPGVHNVTSEILLPTTYGCNISGVAGDKEMAEIQAPASVAAGIFQIVPVAPASTVVYRFNNLYIEHGDQIGIQIDNTNAAKKIILSMGNVEFGGDEVAIDADHAGASDAIRIYVNESTIEGKINFDVGNNDDRISFRNSTLEGVLDTTGDNTTLKLRAQNCLVPHGAWATNGGTTSQLCICLGCYAITDQSTIAALDTNEIGAGAKYTETIIA